MSPLDFLQAVLPAEGFVVIALPTRSGAYKHHVFDTIPEAATFVDTIATQCDVFFGTHTLRERRVWDPAKKAPDGSLGAWKIRGQNNSRAAKSHFFDLDIGPEPHKYPDQATAIADLKRFCQAAGLPKPLIVSSGRGVHVYWRYTEAVPSPEWRGYAVKLRALAKHHGLKFDPSRTTDSSSVLRVVGTYNHKDPSVLKPVKVLADGGQLGAGAFLKTLDDAVIRAGIEIRATPLTVQTVSNSLLDQLGTQETEFNGEPVPLVAMAKACKQVEALLTRGGNVDEPTWYHTINLLRFTKNGRKHVHKWSKLNYPAYNASEVDAKLDQLEGVREQGTGTKLRPTSCLKLVETTGRDDLCEGCPFVTKVKSPIVAATFRNPAPPPVVHLLLGQTTQTVTIPEPPEPFERIKNPNAAGFNMVAMSTTDSKGNKVEQVIYPNDLFPLRRVRNAAMQVEQHVWRVVLPLEGTIDFTMDADALYDRRRLMSAMAHAGVIPQHNQLQYVQDYMVAYINKLQSATRSEAQCNHLGWNDDHTEFTLPDKIIQSDGTARPASLSVGAQRATMYLRKEGTLARQIELLRFWNDKRYTPQKFMIICSLAAPLFEMTGYHGVIVNASGDAGASKSTSLYTGMSFWGHPELATINGTNNGATVRGRNERITTLANLPICVDEITHIPPNDARDLAMSITQPGHRIRLEQSGIERAAVGSHKATIMCCTANNSLHTLLSMDNSAGTAGSMRVFEIVFKYVGAHKKHEADEYLRELKENYGHIGELFISYVIQHREKIRKRLHALMRQIDIQFNIQPSERFWSAVIAAVIVACEIANLLGFVTWDPQEILDWIASVELPHLRQTVSEEYSSPMSILADYLSVIHSETIVTNGRTGAFENVTHSPKLRLSAHWDQQSNTLWILKKSFKDYCARIGANSRSVLQSLSELTVTINGRTVPVIIHKHHRKVLGAGTDYARAQAWCFAIDMRHPEVTGSLVIATPPGQQVQTTPPTGNLKAVP